MNNLYESVKKKDNVNNGMMTKVWGPPGWMFLHIVTMGYPVKIDNFNEEHLMRKRKIKEFFNNLGYILPCRYCRESYLNFIKETPIDDHLNTRVDLAKWFYDIHNKVNYKLGVPECNIPSFEDFYKEYDTYRAKCKKTTEEEREENLKKGCVVPADGKKKKCLVKVVKVDKSNKEDILKIIIVMLIITLILILFMKYSK